MTGEQIKENIALLRQVMDEKVGVDSPQCVLEKLNKLNDIIGLSGECIAQATRLYNEKAGIMVPRLKGIAGATEKKLTLASLCSEELYLVDLTKSANKDAHYSIEALRSILSFIKQELGQISSSRM